MSVRKLSMAVAIMLCALFFMVLLRDRAYKNLFIENLLHAEDVVFVGSSRIIGHRVHAYEKAGLKRVFEGGFNLHCLSQKSVSWGTLSFFDSQSREIMSVGVLDKGLFQWRGRQFSVPLSVDFVEICGYVVSGYND